MSYKKSWPAIISVCAFLLAISLPLAGAILQEDRTLSYTEKRKLQTLPPFPDNWQGLPGYISMLEEYYNDQFGFRDFFLEGYARFKKVIGDHDISGISENVGTKNVIEGKNGWFFLNRKWDGDPFSDYRNIDLYSDSELLQATLLFAARADWLKEQNIEYLFFFAPNKHTIYSEYLPEYIKKEGDISSWDQLNDALLRFTDVNFVDLREPLLQAKDQAGVYWKDAQEDAALYYKMDSHWNAAGADIAQFAIAQKIQQLFPGKIDPSKRPPEDFTMRRFTGDITLIMGGKDEEAYGPHLTGGTCTPEKFMDYLQRFHETRCANGSLDALIFNDSFLPPLKPYFTDYFKRVKYFWESMRESIIVEQSADYKPDIVIEQRAERFLPFTPRSEYQYYNAFWDKHWEKWEDIVYESNLSEIGNGSQNLKYAYRKNTSDLEVNALSNDPVLYLPEVKFLKDRLYLIRVVIESEHDTELQLFYSTLEKEDQYPAESESVSISLKKGLNKVHMPLFSMNLAGDLRLDPGKKAGRYVIKELKIKELEWVDLK